MRRKFQVFIIMCFASVFLMGVDVGIAATFAHLRQEISPETGMVIAILAISACFLSVLAPGPEK